MFTEDNIVNDVSAYQDACEEFEARYGHNISDVIFGSKETDWKDADLVSDAKVLDAWDCWLFVADACPNYADYGKWVENGGYEDPATDAVIMSHINSGNVEMVAESITTIPTSDVVKVIGSIA